jgi:uncharacterized RDD family membrane protein YckC
MAPARRSGAPNRGLDGMPIDIKPHAYDPVTQPELFEGVLPRRIVAFVIDVFIITVPVVLAAMFIFAFGIVTLGLGWALFFLIPPATVIWAIVYFGLTLSGPASATIGMRTVDLEMRTWYGAPAYFVLGAVHAIVFWLSIFGANAVHPAGGVFQRAPAPAARYPAGHRGHQQCPPRRHAARRHCGSPRLAPELAGVPG